MSSGDHAAVSANAIRPTARRCVATSTRATATTGLLLVATLLTGGCKAATMAYGADPATARANADALAAAMEQRFTRVVRLPKFEHARMRIGRYAFAPSKLANDTALWTGMRSTRAGADRDLEVGGGMINGAYTFATRTRPAELTRLGESRHFVGLTQLNGDDDWQWTTTVSNAIGPLPPLRTTDIMRALLLSAERPPAAIRDDYRTAFPRSAASLGRLFSIDSVITARQPDGSTTVALHVALSDERLRATFPEFARFVHKYVGPARYRFRLRDRVGSDWFDVSGAKSRVVLRFRSHEGELQPLLGAARRMPDTLAIHVEAFEKLSLFTVGVSDLLGEFVHVSTPTDRSWSMRFRTEPKWHLPLIGERLLRTPLKRPFEGQGVRFRIGFTRAAEGQTLFGRTSVIAVRESAIMRFLGNLGFTAMSDYAGKVEDEENRFLAETFAALRADIAAQ
jgi:hypothetical protein